MYNITLEYYLLEILLVSSNRYLLNGGVILRIYYVREISINLLSRFLRKESCRSIFLLLFFFSFNDGTWKLRGIIEFDLFLERNENGSPRNPWLDRWFARSCSLDGERVWLNIVERVGCALAGLKCESVPWIRPWYSCISQSTSNRPSTGWANSYTRSRFQSWPRYLDFFPPNPGRDIRFL